MQRQVSTARVSTAIVAEGGGQRGIYTAGVLDAFAGERFNPFDLGIGVSAGAQNLLAYFLERPGYARLAIERLTAAKQFYVPYRWLTRGNVIDLDGYFERTLSDPDYRLDYPRLGELEQKRRLLFVATCRDTLEPRYLEPTVATVVDCLKASAAVPLLYRSGVAFDGECLIDGGVADALPIGKALDEGAQRVLVVRTSRRDTSCTTRPLDRFRRAGAVPAGLRRMIESYERGHERAARRLANVPDTVEVIELQPSQPLLSQLFGSRSDTLAQDYATGLADGLAALQRLAHWSRPLDAAPEGTASSGTQRAGRPA